MKAFFAAIAAAAVITGAAACTPGIPIIPMIPQPATTADTNPNPPTGEPLPPPGPGIDCTRTDPPVCVQVSKLP